MSQAPDLLAPWTGPCGGLPPFDRATPSAIETAYRAAWQAKRDEVRAIADNPAAPTFENTVEALENSGRALRRVQVLNAVFSATNSVGAMPAVTQRLAPLGPMLDDEIAHNAQLFARIEAVWQAADRLDGQQRRLVQVLRERLQRQGAALSATDKARLQQINSSLAALSARFSRNLLQAQSMDIVWITDPADLAGLSEAQVQALAAQAAAEGRPGQWAVPCLRPIVWPLLIHSTVRALREKVWRLWSYRGEAEGALDNRPVIAAMLALRGEKARLLGFPTYAHFRVAERMAGTPEAALGLLHRTWAAVLPATRAQIAEMQAIATAEGQSFELAPWDRLHYAEKLRRARFGFDTDAVKPYLELESMLAAMIWCAGRVHGLSFTPLHGAPVVHPSVRVYQVSRAGAQVGVLYVDLFNRPGKQHGSYQNEYRSHENFRGEVLPISSMVSSFPPPTDGQPVLLPWEYANVFFHEFGHALHMLCNRARYATLGSQNVPWDFVELPSFINERWLQDDEVLARFARHHETGEPMPSELLAGLRASLRFDRVISLNLDYLAPAIIDLTLHLAADGEPDHVIDAAQVEHDTLAALGMPAAWDQVMRAPHFVHAFANAYDAGMYSYLWSDVMVADAAEAFVEAPGGLFDATVAKRWMDTVLSVGNTVPADQAYRNFRGRDPEPDALLRRFGLEATVSEVLGAGTS